MPEQELISEIVNQLIAATPEWWNEARLEVTNSTDDGIDSLGHSISSSQFPRDIVVATDELFEATRKLALWYRDKGHEWKSAVFQIHQNEDGDWKFQVDYSY